MKDQERTPLRTILLNFLNHIENLEAHRSPEDSYETEFQELKLFSETLKTLKQYSCSEGEKEVNRKKNRYKDILPFDLSRVILNEYAGIPGSDYINANYIKGASGSPAYIASQGPLPHTVNDFWRMVVQCEVQVIVMACNEEEAGKHKCENYWVEGEGEEKQFGMVTIRLIKASTVCPDFSVRTMRLKYTNTNSSTEERTVCQFHYSAWPDHGVPPLVRPLLDMVRLVRDTQASETLPVLVHCSAGCGRTGTICAIDYVWGLLRAGKLTKDFSLLSLVREMRKQRIAMVQTKEQYVLVHRAVRELFKEQLRMIDSHPYENIDYNGMPLDSEPTYDTIETNINSTEEKTKKDDKEKEVTVSAPPLPQKKRFPVPSSKREKEAENLSEKLRIAEQAESHIESPVIGIGHRPRIAKLKSLFERETKQVSRSHSLGAPRKTHVVKKEARPTPSHEVLSVPQLPEQYPALPVKRSKSLRVLGSSDRYRLSVVTGPTPLVDEKSRRLSLESNMDVCEKDNLQEGGKYFSGTGADSVIAGLAVRERRNSFREAVSKTELDYENLPRKPGAGSLVRSYTAIDIRPSVRHNFEVKTDYNKPVLQPKPLTKPALSCHRLNIVRPPVSVNEVWPSEKQKKSIVPKSEYSNSQNSLVALRKYKLNATVSCCRPSPPPPPPPPPPPVHSGSVMKGLPKKEKKILQSSPQVNDRGVQQFVLPSSKLQLDACGSNVSKQEGGYSQTPDTVHVWRKQLQCASDKRVSNKTMKSVRLHALPKTNHSYRGQIQMLRSNVVDFDKDMLLVPSYNESLARYNCKTNVQQQLNTSQNQTPVRLHNSRNVIYDSKFSQDCHKYPASSRHMQGKDLVMNERQLCHGHQKPKQFYQENNLHQATIYSDCHPESSSKLMGRQLSVVEGTQSSHKNPLSPQVGQRKNSADVLDDKQVNHFDDSKVNSSSVGRSINMNDCRYYSKSSNNELKVMSDSELVACKDGTARVNMSVSSPDQYRSPPLYSVPGQQTSDNISRSQLAHTNGPEFTGYGGMKPRRGSQDDLALCTAGGPVTPSRVKRHASVVVLRHSFIESSDGSRPLAVWNSPQVNGDIRGSATQNPHFSKESEDPWSGAVGVDLDEVAASMTSQKDGSSSKLMKAALQALHQRKGVNAAGEYNKTPENVTGSSGAQQHSGTSMKNISTTSPVQSPPFRKQQQYL